MKETGESGSTKNKTVILLLIILLTLLWFVGEILVSCHWMKVNRYPVQVRNLRYADTVTDAGFKMVVLSDLHDHEFGKDNEKLIRCVKEQDPEMIILDGDMLNEDSKSDEVPVRLVKGLAEIAPVYYALGLYRHCRRKEDAKAPGEFRIGEGSYRCRRMCAGRRLPGRGDRWM